MTSATTGIFVLQCPKCDSSHLTIKHTGSVLRIRMFFTGELTYLCERCQWAFLVSNRLRKPRPDPSAGEPFYSSDYR
jgi:transposase-like protein